MGVFNKKIKDRYFTFIDVNIESYSGNQRVVISEAETDFEAVLGIEEIDELIKTLEEAKEVLARGRNTNE